MRTIFYHIYNNLNYPYPVFAKTQVFDCLD